MSQDAVEAIGYVRENKVLKLVSILVVGLLAVPFGGPLLYSSNPRYDLIEFIGGLIIVGGGAFLTISAGVALIYKILLDTRTHR